MMSNMLKLAYRNPRPYWENEKITGWNCEKTFGNPSRYTLWCVGASMAIVLDVIRSNPHGKFMQLITIITTLFLGGSISWVHLAIGANSLD